jgi:S-DNA-T family DNA segregation ATPase FtsK/SpoIIIE
MISARVRPLTQRELDVAGLALIALGVFCGLVLWGDVRGGAAGHGLDRGLAWLVGEARFVAPPLLAGAGALVVLRPVLTTTRPFRIGALCVLGALTLALAADTLGVAPGGVRHGFWHAGFFEARGGVAGEALYWASSQVAGDVGSGVLACFLLLAGLPLLTGASIASALRVAGSGVGEATRALRRTAAWAGSTSRASLQGAGPDAAPVTVPEPADVEPVVHAAAEVEGPPVDGVARFPELFGASEPRAARAPVRGVGSAADDGDPGAEPKAERLNPKAEAGEDPKMPGVARVDGLTPQGRLRESVTDDPSFEWALPDPGLLRRSSVAQARPDTAGQERVSAQLVEALGHHGVQASVVGTVAGPHITRYELRLAPGTKVGKVSGLKDDLAYALAATEIRILAPIPGKQAVGVEVPNAKRRIVQLGDVFREPKLGFSPLSVWLGKDVSGQAICADLTRMPHLLVAGTTGSGKSAAINAMLCSILLRATPHELRLVLVDPKQVELNHYDSIPHLLTPVITSPRMAANALANLVREMEQRYGIMSLSRTRSLVELNRVRREQGEPELPHILCVIDELADLMMVAPADVEDSVIRLAQKARAVGIHLVLATQSPRVDVITGMIKANVPSRIAFAVSSQTDSRVILDHNGAESLLGMGDMLFSPVGSSRLQRIQGAYIDEPQIGEITDFWRRQGEPEFHEELLEEVTPREGGEGGPADEGSPDEDPLLTDAVALVVEMGTASTSMLQRRLRLGYTRAGRLIDMLERRGIISGYEGSKPRQVLVSEADLPRVLAALAERAPGAGAGARAGEPGQPDPGASELGAGDGGATGPVVTEALVVPADD